MGCTCAGFFAVLILLIAVGANVVSLVLPLWSASDNFSTGLFAICIGDSCEPLHGGGSVCELYGIASSYMEQIASIFGFLGDIPSMSDFLDNTCGWMGMASLAMGVLAAAVGVVAFALCLFVCCCNNKSCFNATVLTFTAIAFVANALTWILWLVQSAPLRDNDMSPSVSFALSLVSCGFFAVAAALLAYHRTTSVIKTQASIVP